MSSIAGQVKGPHAGLKIVLYARSGQWYVQPYADQVFTTINPDGTWNSPTHLGTDYAALLVQPDYVPPPVIDNLPGVAGGITAVSSTEGTPPWWQTWWFRVLLLSVVLLVILGLYRLRMRELARRLNVRFEERLAERTRIAQEIHDTLLQGFLSASMQLHLVADQLPEGSSQKEPLLHILKLMGRVVDEGRNAIRGLRPSYVNPYDLEDVFSRLPQELAPSRQTEFRIVVAGQSRSLHPIIRDEVYSIGREAVANALQHCGADSVEVELEYRNRELLLLIRDNGNGIDQQVLQPGEEGHRRLATMRDRAESIGAKMTVLSRPGGGTEVAVAVPGGVAFQSEPGGFPRWLRQIFLRYSQTGKTRTPERQE